MSKLGPFFNPLEWWRAWRYAHSQKGFDKARSDLELKFYSRILRNDMLHYGYFDDASIKPEDISFRMFENAQLNYAHRIIRQLKSSELPVLDVGCGMGGLARLLRKEYKEIECLSPNARQIDYINQSQPGLTSHHCRYEEFKSRTVYGNVINAESLQYIPLNTAFEKTSQILAPGGRWVITDYFRTASDSRIDRPHLLEDFLLACRKFNFSVIHEEDMTLHVLPTIEYVDMYVKRFLYPLRDLGFDKLRIKKPILYYLSKNLRMQLDNKIEKETRTVDPKLFTKERTYRLYVLERANVKDSQD